MTRIWLRLLSKSDHHQHTSGILALPDDIPGMAMSGIVRGAIFAWVPAKLMTAPGFSATFHQEDAVSPPTLPTLRIPLRQSKVATGDPLWKEVESCQIVRWGIFQLCLPPRQADDSNGWRGHSAAWWHDAVLKATYAGAEHTKRCGQPAVSVGNQGVFFFHIYVSWSLGMFHQSMGLREKMRETPMSPGEIFDFP